MHFDKLKVLYEEHRTRIPVALEFLKDCVSYAASMRENPNLVDYIDLGFGIKESYEEYYGDSNPRDYFSGKEWHPLFTEAFIEYIVALILQSKREPARIVKNSENAQALVTKIDGVEVGWVTIQGETKNFWVKSEHQNRAFGVIGKLFWEQHSSNRVVVTADSNKLSIKDDLNHGNFIISAKCIEYGTYIKKFREGGLSRSILFYGPPGSGKSNLVKGINNVLRIKSLRFENLNALHNNFVTEIIKVVNPDCIILEDIDHLTRDELVDLLDKIEDFNNENKLVFATANRASKLDNALLRPGRFDEAIEIKTIDEEILLKLVNGDVEIFDIVKTYPVAFTVELMKRVKILGKAEALKNIKDLQDRVDNFSLVNYELKAKVEEADENNIRIIGPKLGNFKIGSSYLKSGREVTSETRSAAFFLTSDGQILKKGA